ncbi:MAG: hypothetical protein PVH58_16820, partial [Desulfobacterales bacterium]
MAEPVISEPRRGDLRLALWNACPMKCEAYFIGAKPIPLGWLIKTRNNKHKTTCFNETLQQNNRYCNNAE